MKKILAHIALVSCLFVSCKDDHFQYEKPTQTEGTLSFAEFTLDIDETVNSVTKADAADGSYTLFLYDSSNALVWQKSYSEINGTDGITLTAGTYTLDVRSTSGAVPAAKFSTPVYGARKTFEIQVGQTTNLGTVTCTLLQTAVTIEYNDGFLSTVSGDGSTSVEVTSGSPLVYNLNYNSGRPTYERRIGYFAVGNDNNTSMTITFKGLIEGKTQKMTTTLTRVKARDWHIVTFIKKTDAVGNASFAINIDGLIADATLDNDITGAEEGDGDDPSAPSGDGGIELNSTCDYDISNDITVPAEGAFNLTMQAVVPNGARKFTVDIDSTNSDFISSVNTVGGTTLDLINPSEAAMGVFDIVPFPHGSSLLNATQINFDLAGAQTPLLAFKGTHTFTMNVTDNRGSRKSIAINLFVE